MDKIERPKAVDSITRKVTTGCGSMYVTLGFTEGGMLEVFASLGKSGGCALSQLEGLTRCITLGLRHGIPVYEYVEELKDIKCPSQIPGCFSCSDGISSVLAEFVDVFYDDMFYGDAVHDEELSSDEEKQDTQA